MRALLVRLGLAATLMALPAAAQAMLQTAIFRAPTSGTDVTGVFGVPGQVFDAAPTTLRFYFDATPGAINPVYRASLDIFGQSVSFKPTQSSYLLDPWDIHEGPVFHAVHETGEPDVTPYRLLDFMGRAHGVPPTFLVAFVDFSFFAYDPQAGITEHAFGTGSETGLSRFQIVNFVPEPASWMMMIAGFGLVGAAMRRRSLATV